MNRILVVISIIVLTFSCKKEPTQWNSDWVVPLFNDTLSISNFVNDSTLSVNADKSVQLSLNRRVLELDLFSLINFPDTTLVQDFSIAFSSLELPPGTQYVNEVKDHNFNLGDVVLSRARVVTGIAIVQIENPVETECVFEIELPGVTKGGVNFLQTEVVPRKIGGVPGKKTYELDLSGYMIDLTGMDGQQVNTIQSKMSVRTNPDGPTVIITNSDLVKLSVQMDQLKFDYAKGFFGTTKITDTTTLTIETLTGIQSGIIQLDEVKIDLNIENGVKTMAQGIITKIVSKNNQQQTVSLTHPNFNQTFNINPAQGSWSTLEPSEVAFNFTSENSSVQPFIENLGSRYTIGYGLFINPWGNISGGNDEIFPQSRIRLNLKTDFPLTVGVDNLVLVDTFEVNFTEQRERAKIISGQLLLTARNSFPFGGNIVLDFMDEENNLIERVESPTGLKAAPYMPGMGEHTTVVDELSFDISETLISAIHDVTTVIVRINVNSTNFEGNVLYDNASISLNLKAAFKLNTAL